MNIFNYFDSDVIAFTFQVEDVERRPQQHYGEYYWLGPELTLYTQGRYILIFLVVLINLTLASPTWRFLTGIYLGSHYIPLMVLWLASTATEDHCRMPVAWHI